MLNHATCSIRVCVCVCVCEGGCEGRVSSENVRVCLRHFSLALFNTYTSNKYVSGDGVGKVGVEIRTLHVVEYEHCLH